MSANTQTKSKSSSDRYMTWLKLLRMVVMMRLSSAQLRASLNTRSSRAVLRTDRDEEPEQGMSSGQTKNTYAYTKDS